MRRGEIYQVDLEPTKGREQRSSRHVLVVSPDAMNRHFPPIVAPISTGAAYARDAGFTVSLANYGLQTTGVVLCHQIRVLDVRARNGRRIEMAPDVIVGEVLAALQDIFEF